MQTERRAITKAILEKEKVVLELFNKIQRFKEQYPNEVLLKEESNGSSSH